MNGFDLKKLDEFDNHKLVQFLFDEKTGLHGFVVIHRGNNGNPALGATRLWEYKSEEKALRDALRLSRTMSYKSALAGLPYGGAKAVLISSAKIKSRKKLFTSYAKEINSLDGKFITGSDVGVTSKDVQLIRQHTPYIIGNRLDPAYYTALGVYYGIQEALRYVFGSGNLKNRSFAIQGTGKTGSHLLKLIYPFAEKIFIADIDKEKVKKMKHNFPKVRIVNPSNITKQKVDVFSPCAVSGAINSENVTNLHCSIIAGSANNQLENENIDILLYKLGILYSPDYVINAGGLISVVDEMEQGRPSKKRILKRIVNIQDRLKNIFNQSSKKNRSTGEIAKQIAESVFNK